ncbi:MAG: inositol monophosphatase family protein [Elusimicrobiota bacterium]
MGLGPWDTAAGIVIVTEAGGKVTGLTGEKYSHYQQNILASNGKIHQQLIKTLLGNGVKPKNRD